MKQNELATYAFTIYTKNHEIKIPSGKNLVASASRDKKKVELIFLVIFN